MSTKNLARTVIEGGRARYNKFDRRHSSAVERCHAHQLERALCDDRERDDEVVFAPRRPVYPGFRDKLNPARRWLASQLGRPWNKVRSELFARFDTRTTPGRHILFDHLLDEVEDLRGWHYGRFGISSHGLLERREQVRWSDRRRPRLPEPEPTLRAWLGERRVVEHGQRLYWLVPTPHGGFRQQQELAPHDAARFRALPHWFREPLTGPPPRVADFTR